MNDQSFAHLRCMSCTARGAMPVGDNETTVETTARLRAKMGVNCPRPDGTRHLCPMRSEQREAAR